MIEFVEFDGIEIWRSKEKKKLFTERPTHGSVGWFLEGETWVELRYWNNSDPKGWIPLEEYLEKTALKKRINAQYFKDNPRLLFEKIRSKMRGPRLLRISPSSARIGWVNE